MQRLAMTLRLNESERVTLYQMALGHTPPPVSAGLNLEVEDHLQVILDDLAPHPAYVSNLRWDIVAYNEPQLDWFPWLPYERNLMRFAFLYPEAREQLVNWHKDWALPFLAQIRYAIATHPDAAELADLRDEILAGNDQAQELWGTLQTRAHPDGDVRRFRLPVHNDEEVEVRIVAFAPLSDPSLRVVVLVRT